MDAGDFWKLLVGGVVTLVGSALLHQLQLGTRRRRRRRDIREQLELLALLGDHPVAAARVRRRVTAALDAYEPSVAVIRKRRGRLISAASFVSANVILIGIAIAAKPGVPTLGEVLFLSVGIVAFAFALEDLLSRTLQTRAEDIAVGSAVSGTTWSGTAVGKAGLPDADEQSVDKRPNGTRR
ncbi:hypothetical protein AAII07_08185 [Microvirga sp. 0TCS3.31]